MHGFTSKLPAKNLQVASTVQSLGARAVLLHFPQDTAINNVFV